MHANSRRLKESIARSLYGRFKIGASVAAPHGIAMNVR
jgi:hypothetical protein